MLRQVIAIDGLNEFQLVGLRGALQMFRWIEIQDAWLLKEPRILNLDPAEHLQGAAQANQLEFIQSINRDHLAQHPGELDLEARIASYELAARMQVAAKEALDISSESDATKKLYGIDEEATRDYGTRCLIARRLVQRGVRFVQVLN